VLQYIIVKACIYGGKAMNKSK